MDEETTTNDDQQSTENNGETTSQDQVTTQEGELETESRLTLTQAELEEREREIRRDQDKRWKERLKGVEESKGDRKDGLPKGSQVTDDRYDRLELKVSGIVDREHQDFVIDYARAKNIDIDTALNSRVVRAELAALKEESEKKRATVAPVNRVGRPAEKDATYWANQVKAGKPNSPDPAMRKQVRAILAKEESD